MDLQRWLTTFFSHNIGEYEVVFLSLLILGTNYLVILNGLWISQMCTLGSINIYWITVSRVGLWDLHCIFLALSVEKNLKVLVFFPISKNQVDIFFLKMTINGHKEIRILFCLFFLSQGLLLGPFLKAYMKNLFLIDHK